MNKIQAKKRFFLLITFIISLAPLQRAMGLPPYEDTSKIVTNIITNTFSDLKLPKGSHLTQTIAYLSNNDLREDLNHSYSDAVERIGKPFFKKLFTSTLKREVDFTKKDYRVFYHGQDRVFMLFHDIYKGLYKIAHKKSLKHFIMLRLNDKSFGKFKNINQFLRYYIDNGQIHDHWTWFDQQPHTKKLLLSVNPSLFGNTSRAWGGECTFDYFINSNSVSQIDIENLISNIFKAFNYQTLFWKYQSAIQNLHDLLAAWEHNKTGTLLQIFVPNKLVDILAYRCQPGGFLYHDDDKPQLHNASADLAEYQKGTDLSSCSFDTVQFRLLINNLTLDPKSGIRFFRYYKKTDNIKKYEVKLAQLLKKIEKDLNKMHYASENFGDFCDEWLDHWHGA